MAIVNMSEWSDLLIIDIYNWSNIMAISIEQQVQSAIKTYGNARIKVQKTAVQVLIHAYQHGDYTQATVLCEGIGNKSLVKWFVDFGGLTVEGNKFTGWKGAKFIEENLGTAKKTNYWEYKAESIWKGIDEAKLLDMVIKRGIEARKIVAENPEQAGKAALNDDLHDGLVALREQLAS